MTRWEYKYEKLTKKGEFQARHIEGKLKDLGEAEWELCSVIRMKDDSLTGIFKKEIRVDSED